MGPRLVVGVLDDQSALYVDVVLPDEVESADDYVRHFFLCASKRDKTKVCHLRGLVTRLVQFVRSMGLPKLRDFSMKVGTSDGHGNWFIVPTFTLGYLPNVIGKRL